MYGQVTDRDGIRIIVVGANNHYYQTSKCENKWEDLQDINQDHVRDYRKISEKYSVIKEESPEISKVPTERYTWSTNLSKDDAKYSAIRLDDTTLVFSSKYFPGDLAKLIYSGGLRIFVHYDGRVILKRWDCMYLNEKILIKAINQNLVDQKGSLRFSIQSRDKAFKKFLENNKFDELEFENEQNFIITYTYAEYAAMQKAVLAQGSDAINSHRVHMDG